MKDQINGLIVDLQTLVSGLQRVSADWYEVELLEKRTAAANAERDEASRQLAEQKAELREVQAELVKAQASYQKLSEELGVMAVAKRDMKKALGLDAA
jgi:chromosome segregation ATPase